MSNVNPFRSFNKHLIIIFILVIGLLFYFENGHNLEIENRPMFSIIYSEILVQGRETKLNFRNAQK